MEMRGAVPGIVFGGIQPVSGVRRERRPAGTPASGRWCLADAYWISDSAALWGQLLAEARVKERVVNAAYEAVTTLSLRGQAGQS